MDEIPERIAGLKAYGRFSAYAGEMDMKILNIRAVDDSKITDHHAILPTENIPKELTATSVPFTNDSRSYAGSLFTRLP